MNGQFTVRVYDSKVANKIDELYENCKDIYITKNPFLVDCIRRGAETIERDLLGQKKILQILQSIKNCFLVIIICF